MDIQQNEYIKQVSGKYRIIFHGELREEEFDSLYEASRFMDMLEDICLNNSSKNWKNCWHGCGK